MEIPTNHHAAVDDQTIGAIPEVAFKPMTRAEIQRAHTQVAARLGDVACNGRDTVACDPQP